MAAFLRSQAAKRLMQARVNDLASCTGISTGRSICGFSAGGSISGGGKSPAASATTPISMGLSIYGIRRRAFCASGGHKLEASSTFAQWIKEQSVTAQCLLVILGGTVAIETWLIIQMYADEGTYVKMKASAHEQQVSRLGMKLNREISDEMNKSVDSRFKVSKQMHELRKAIAESSGEEEKLLKKHKQPIRDAAVKHLLKEYDSVDQRLQSIQDDLSKLRERQPADGEGEEFKLLTEAVSGIAKDMQQLKASQMKSGGEVESTAWGQKLVRTLLSFFRNVE